jgi:hypothetical protein
VPAKPLWYNQLDAIIQALETYPRPFVDRATVEYLLGVGRRRAQQIMEPCVTDRIGANGLADRVQLVARLRALAQSEDRGYEQQRRKRVGKVLNDLRKAWLEQPRVLVEAPVSIVNQEFEDLPRGIRVEGGRISIEFDEPQQALEKLLALAMAIGNNLDHFEHLCAPQASLPR